MKGDISICIEILVIRITMPEDYKSEFSKEFKEQVFAQPDTGYVGIEGIQSGSKGESVIRVRVRKNQERIFISWLKSFVAARNHSAINVESF